MKPKLVESASSGSASGTVADERYRKLVEGLTDHAVFLLDSEGMIQSANTGVRLIHGYEAHEIVGRSMSLLYPDEANARGWPAHELRVAREDGRFEDEGWRMRKDGTRFWGNVVITAMRDTDGKLTGFSKIARDLTERRRHEELTRRSEERFRLLVERVKDYAIFMLTPEGRVASWNDGAQHIKGYTAREIVGEHVSRFYEAEAIARRWPEHELAVARKTGRFEDEGWRVRKDGTRFWANVVITALHDDAGELYGFAKVTRDLTDTHAGRGVSAQRAADERIPRDARPRVAQSPRADAYRARCHESLAEQCGRSGADTRRFQPAADAPDAARRRPARRESDHERTYRARA